MKLYSLCSSCLDSILDKIFQPSVINFDFLFFKIETVTIFFFVQWNSICDALGMRNTLILCSCDLTSYDDLNCGALNLTHRYGSSSDYRLESPLDNDFHS